MDKNRKILTGILATSIFVFVYGIGLAIFESRHIGLLMVVAGILIGAPIYGYLFQKPPKSLKRNQHVNKRKKHVN